MDLYRPPVKLREGSVFTRACLFTGLGSPCDHYPWWIGHYCTGPPPPPSQTSDLGPPTTDIWWANWRPFKSCSLEDPPSDIWWWPLKHVWFASGQYASYWNAFFVLLWIHTIVSLCGGGHQRPKQTVLCCWQIYVKAGVVPEMNQSALILKLVM